MVGSDPDRIVSAVNDLLMSQTRYAAMARPSLAFGDGRAAERIADILYEWLGREVRLAV